MAKVSAQNEKQAIMCTHQQTFIYSHVGNIYEIIPNSSQWLTDLINHKYETNARVVVGFVSLRNIDVLASQMGKKNISSSFPTSKPSSQTPSSLVPTSNVNSV